MDSKDLQAMSIGYKAYKGMCLEARDALWSLDTLREQLKAPPQPHSATKDYKCTL